MPFWNLRWNRFCVILMWSILSTWETHTIFYRLDQTPIWYSVIQLDKGETDIGWSFCNFHLPCLLRIIWMYYYFVKVNDEDIVILCLLVVVSVVMLWFSYRNATVILSCKEFPLARSTTKRIKLFEVVFRYNTLHPAWRGSHRGVFTNYLFVFVTFSLIIEVLLRFWATGCSRVCPRLQKLPKYLQPFAGNFIMC